MYKLCCTSCPSNKLNWVVSDAVNEAIPYKGSRKSKFMGFSPEKYHKHKTSYVSRVFRRLSKCYQYTPSLAIPTEQLTYLLHRAESFLRSQLVLQLIKKFPAFYGTPKFITVLTSARDLSLSWANSIQSPQALPTSSRSILILSSHLRLGLPNGLFLQNNSSDY